MCMAWSAGSTQKAPIYTVLRWISAMAAIVVVTGFLLRVSAMAVVQSASNWFRMAR